MTLNISHSEEEKIIIYIILVSTMDSGIWQLACPAEYVNCKNPRASGRVTIRAKKLVDTKKPMFNNFTVLLLMTFSTIQVLCVCLFFLCFAVTNLKQ